MGLRSAKFREANYSLIFTMGTETRDKLVARLKAKVEKRRQEAAVKSVTNSGAGWNRQAFVRVSNFEFVPNCVVVLKGASVTWTCCSQDSLLGPEVETHRIKFKDARFPVSEDLRSGESFTVTFEEAGVFSYYCANYNFVTGYVKVLEDKPVEKSSSDVSAAELERLAEELEQKPPVNRKNKKSARNNKTSISQSPPSSSFQIIQSKTGNKASSQNGEGEARFSPSVGKQIQQNGKTNQRRETTLLDEDEDGASETSHVCGRSSSPSDHTCSATEASTDFDDFSEKKSEGCSLHDFNESDVDEEDSNSVGTESIHHLETVGDIHGRQSVKLNGFEFPLSSHDDQVTQIAMLVSMNTDLPAEADETRSYLLSEQAKLEQEFSAAASANLASSEWIDAAPRRKRRNRPEPNSTGKEAHSKEIDATGSSEVSSKQDLGKGTSTKTLCSTSAFSKQSKNKLKSDTRENILTKGKQTHSASGKRDQLEKVEFKEAKTEMNDPAFDRTYICELLTELYNTNLSSE